MFSLDKKQPDDFARHSEMIEKAITAFSAEFCEKGVTATDERFEVLRQRIDLCWESHVDAARRTFGPAAVDELDVYAGISRGEKYLPLKVAEPVISLAGNPIRDIGEGPQADFFNVDHVRFPRK